MKDKIKEHYLSPEYFQNRDIRLQNGNHSIVNNFLAFIGGVYLFFYLRRPFKEYTILLVTNEELLKKVYEFRYHIYCVTDKLLNAEEYYEREEYDKYDKYSYQFAVLDNTNQVIGTFRLIKDSEYGFPTEHEFNLVNVPPESRGATVEISRLMVSREFRKTMLLLDILRVIFIFSKTNNIKYWYGCAETWFIKTLDKILGPLEVINKPRHCFNAVNYPFIFSMNELIKNVQLKSALLLHFFNHQPKNEGKF